MDAWNLQEAIDEATDGDVITLRQGECAGPITINRAITLEGGTVWARRGPVISINADGVNLRKLRVEVTGPASESCGEAGVALKVASGLQIALSNVTVSGSVEGLEGEAETWAVPRSLDLGRIAPRATNSFVVVMHTPLPCQISTEIAGLQLDHTVLKPGLNRVTLTLRDVPANTIIHGALDLRTTFLVRSLPITATTVNADGKAPAIEAVIWQPEITFTSVASVPPVGGSVKVEPVDPAARPGESAPPPSAPVMQEVAPTQIVPPVVLPSSPPSVRLPRQTYASGESISPIFNVQPQMDVDHSQPDHVTAAKDVLLPLLFQSQPSEVPPPTRTQFDFGADPSAPVWRQVDGEWIRRADDRIATIRESPTLNAWIVRVQRNNVKKPQSLFSSLQAAQDFADEAFLEHVVTETRGAETNDQVNSLLPPDAQDQDASAPDRKSDERNRQGLGKAFRI